MKYRLVVIAAITSNTNNLGINLATGLLSYVSMSN